jgi:protein-S-isoprenylcysteine O-methyltransferase Ste14
MGESVSKVVIIGWIIELVGTILWLYGYFATGNPSLIDWHTTTPWWIAEFLPNIESEIGMALVFAGMILIYWPSRRNDQTAPLDPANPR